MKTATETRTPYMTKAGNRSTGFHIWMFRNGMTPAVLAHHEGR